jgi:hypothetical protein
MVKSVTPMPEVVNAAMDGGLEKPDKPKRASHG